MFAGAGSAIAMPLCLAAERIDKPLSCAMNEKKPCCKILQRSTNLLAVREFDEQSRVWLMLLQIPTR